MAPFANLLHPDTLAYFLVFLAVGMAFGAILEMSGFGDSRKLAAQFYFKEMTVLKVMFTAIVTAAVLIFLSSGLGLLDYDRLWVNPTYLYPGIVGGLIMGAGFIIGGFCPGTSLVAASTLKLDGIFFVLGGLFGVWTFGETVGYFEGFFNSSYYGRLTLFDWMGISAGSVVLILTAMALAMFYLAEIGEAYFAEPRRPVSRLPKSRPKMSAVAALAVVCALIIALGQPSPGARWEQIKGQWTGSLQAREVYVHPGEVRDLKKDPTLYVKVLDLRSEEDFNLFHIAGAERIDPADVSRPDTITSLSTAPDNTVFFLVSNGEQQSLDAWKAFKAKGIANLYIIEGGIGKWLDVFPPESCLLTGPVGKTQPGQQSEMAETGQMNYGLLYAVGSQTRAAHPESVRTKPWINCPGNDAPPSQSGQGRLIPAISTEARAPGESAPPAYIKKVKMQRKAAAKGGCG